MLMTQTPPTPRSSISKTSRCKVLKLKNKKKEDDLKYNSENEDDTPESSDSDED